MKRIFVLLLTALMLFLASSSWANGNSEQAPASITLTVSTNMVGEPEGVLKAIADDFAKANPNIKIDYSAPGKDYENIMKVKMASKQLPDVFSTHGWAIIRYGQFLADLRNESWVPKINSGIRSIITDKNGMVYVLPMDQDKAAIVYNVDVLKQFGVEPPLNLADFEKACETIKEKSNGTVAPIHVGGADSWPIGQLYDFLATSYFVSPASNNASQLLDGSFDWSKWTPLSDKLLDWYNRGFFNKDALTAKFSDSAAALAAGKMAFAFYGGYLVEEAKKTNPNVNGGLIPVPAVVPGDTATFVGGEKATWGAWKDSKRLDAAKKFIAFYAKPENIKRVAESDRLMPGLDGVDVDIGFARQYYDRYKDYRTFPYFDRVYLPNGMFDTLCKNAQDLFAKAVTPDQVSQNFQKEYLRLRAAK